MDMANGEMLHELRRMAESDDLNTKTALRLSLAALAQLHEKTEAILCNQDDASERFADLSTRLEAVKAQAEKAAALHNNPAVRLGDFVAKYPRRVLTGAIVLLLSISALGPVMGDLLVWAGIPASIISLLMGKTP